MIRPKPNRPSAGRTSSASPRLCLALVLGLGLGSGLGGCGMIGFPGVYKIDIEQGNLVVQDMVDQLQVGMSRRQVRFIMGSPLVEDTFHPDRWDYPYVIRNGPDIIRQAQVQVLFDGDRLIDIKGDYLPDWENPDKTADESGSESDSEQENDTEGTD